MRHYWLTCDAPDLPGNAFRKAFGRNRPETLEGKGGGAPAPPDPFQTAAATTQTNEQTADFNKALNLNNYANPFGAQQTNQIGVGAGGAPIYNTTITANPQLQDALNGLIDQTGQSGQINSTALNGLYGLGQQYQGLNTGIGGLQGQYAGLNQNITGLAPQYSSINSQLGGLNSQYAGLGSQLNQGQAAQAGQQGQNAAYAAQTQYLDPQFAQQGESLSAQLANQGLAPGSQAYNNAMTNFNNQKQQAYSNAANESILTGSQIGAQNLSNQIAGINTQSGLLGQQAGLYGQQASNVGQQAGLYGLAGTNLGQQGGLFSLAGSNLGQQAGLYGQQVGIGQAPYSNLQSIASMIPGYSGTGTSAAAPANIAQYQNNAYQGQLANYNADQASQNSTMGTVGTIAAAAAIAF